MAKLYNLARMTTATTGTGTITLGSAVSGYLSFADAGVSDADVVDYAIKDGSNSEIGTGTYTASGTTLTRTVTKSTNSNSAISLSGTAEVFISPRAETLQRPPRGHIYGLTLSNNGTDANNDIDIAAGEAASDDSASQALMNLASSITKRLDAAWAVGSGNGGLDTGTEAASTWYSVWLIERPDTHVVDVLLSASATSPTMPANFTNKRRIGWIYNDASSNILSFSQKDDRFTLGTIVTQSPTITTTATALTLRAPPNSVALFRANIWGHSLQTFLSLYEATQSALTPAITNASINVTGNQVNNAGAGSGGHFEMVVNGSSQIMYDFSNATGAINFGVGSHGWVDTRGRLAA